MATTSVTMVDAHRFSPVVPEAETIYGACCPGWHSAGSQQEAIDQWISFMTDAGIERVCCLLTGRQLDEEDANIARYREAFGEEKVLHEPIPDNRLAEPEQLTDRIVPFLEESDQADEPVVVHCLTGIGRTGQVLAAWLVSQGEYDPRPAIRKVKQTGRDPTEVVRSGVAAEEDLLALLHAVAED